MKNVDVCGESDDFLELLEIAKRIAKTDATILITGESGTGKELIAEYIQQNSLRSEKKFVSINCAAIPANLLENELFGHKKGAFTDAVNDQVGIFGYANGGTLFLDEIGEMDLALQAKLLRFIQYKLYLPVGSNEECYSDIRIIAATNRKLLDLIEKKKFREDLYYRLNVVPVHISPLRERKKDILVLAYHFLEIFSQKYDKNINDFEDNAKKKLLASNWPGNVRELQNIIERSVILSKNKFITANELKFDNEETAFKIDKNIISLKKAIENYKKEYIIYALNQNNWNQTKTAGQLKIQRTYLARLIKELKINKM